MDIRFSGSVHPQFGADSPMRRIQNQDFSPFPPDEDRFSAPGKKIPVKLPNGEVVQLGHQYQGLSPEKQIEAAKNELESVEMQRELAPIQQQIEKLTKKLDEMSTQPGMQEKDMYPIFDELDELQNKLQNSEAGKRSNQNFKKKLEYLKEARVSRLQTGDLLPSDRSRPKYLYHLSTEEGYKKLLASKGMKPYDDGTGVQGIWTVELANFNEEWSKHTEYNHFGVDSPFEALIEWKAQRVAHEPVHTQKLVLLQVEIDPSDMISVRNNSHLFHEQNGEEFVNSIKPLEELTHPPRTDKGLIPEFILHNEIPLERIKVFSGINPALQLPAMKIGAHDLVTHNFFNPHLIDPEQDEVVKETLGIDLKKARSSYSAANRPNPFDIRALFDKNKKTEEADPDVPKDAQH